MLEHRGRPDDETGVCEICWDTFGLPQLEEIAKTYGEPIYGCKNCLAAYNRDDKHRAEASASNRIHKIACIEVALEAETTASYVEWLLFESELEVFDNNDRLVAQHDAFEVEYENACDLIRDVEDQAISCRKGSFKSRINPKLDRACERCGDSASLRTSIKNPYGERDWMLVCTFCREMRKKWERLLREGKSKVNTIPLMEAN